jgi:hypothetical protein
MKVLSGGLSGFTRRVHPYRPQTNRILGKAGHKDDDVALLGAGLLPRTFEEACAAPPSRRSRTMVTSGQSSNCRRMSSKRSSRVRVTTKISMTTQCYLRDKASSGDAIVSRLGVRDGRWWRWEWRKTLPLCDPFLAVWLSRATSQTAGAIPGERARPQTRED